MEIGEAFIDPDSFQKQGKINIPHGTCSHTGDEIIIPATCPECQCRMFQNARTYFYQCTNCRYNTEKIFDEAFLRGVSLGFDVINAKTYKELL